MLVYDEIEKIIFKSALAANDRYIDWTGGDATHDAGIQLLIQNKIAEQLMATEDGGYVLVDSPFVKLRRKALKGKQKRGRTIDDRRRIGIILFNRTNRAIVAVEVKRSFVFSNIRDDIEKLKSLLLRHGHQRDSTLKAGYSVSIREIQEGQKQTTWEALKAILPRVRKLRGMDRIFLRSKISRPKRRRMTYAAGTKRIKVIGFEAVIIRLTLRRPR